MHTANKLSLKDCYAILCVNKDATLEEVKHSYRLQAFQLHPDLNPDNPDAAKNFQLLNEAYVTLSAVLKDKEDREKDGQKKGEQEKDGSKKQGPTEKQRERADKAYAEQDVLRDLLNDPFARRVFEDIYSELSRKQEKKEEEPKQEEPKTEPRPKPRQNDPIHRVSPPKTIRKKETTKTETKPDKGVGNYVKGWLKRQIDEELTISIPAASLVPGNKIRLKISHGLSNDARTIEVTIPRDYVIGKPIRLKGLGMHVGPWHGDLYLMLKGV